MTVKYDESCLNNQDLGSKLERSAIVCKMVAGKAICCTQPSTAVLEDTCEPETPVTGCPSPIDTFKFE